MMANLSSGPPGGTPQGYAAPVPTEESSRQDILNIIPTALNVSPPALTLHPDALRAALVFAAAYLLRKVF